MSTETKVTHTPKPAKRIEVAKEFEKHAVKMAHGLHIERESKDVVAITFDIATLADKASLTTTLRVSPEQATAMANAIIRQANGGAL